MLNQHIVGAEAEAISWQLLQQSSASWPLEEGRGKERKIESERKQINKEGERGGGREKVGMKEKGVCQCQSHSNLFKHNDVYCVCTVFYISFLYGPDTPTRI